MAIWQVTARKEKWNWPMNFDNNIKRQFILNSVTIHFDSVPTTAEELIIKVDSIGWVEYDAILYKIDPSAAIATDIVFMPDRDLFFEDWDIINATYPNSDWNIYWIRIVTQWL